MKISNGLIYKYTENTLAGIKVDQGIFYSFISGDSVPPEPLTGYPYEKYTARTIENDPSVTYDETQKTVIFAEDVEKLNEQVKEIQDAIGLLSAEQMKTIFERLDDLET